jgi:uncharacterized cupredoxin-like copper-binding protein
MLLVHASSTEGEVMARRAVIALLFIIVLTVTTAALLVPAAVGSGSGKYTVTAIDFGFKNMPRRVAPGTHTFTLVNRGEASHDLKLGGKKTKLLNTGERATLRVTLKRGTYVFLCTVPGHAALGMKGKLVVR